MPWAELGATGKAKRAAVTTAAIINIILCICSLLSFPKRVCTMGGKILAVHLSSARENFHIGKWRDDR